MNDAMRYPAGDLTLKLHWLPEQDALGRARRIVLELQDSTGLVVASMSVFKEQLLPTIAQELDLQPLLTLDGCVSVFSDDVTLLQLENRTIPIDQLVATAVSSEMLEDETVAARMLVGFRTRLLKSLEFVETAIASLPKP